MSGRQWRLRTSLIGLLTIISSVTFVVVGAVFVLVRIPQISDETRTDLRLEAADLAQRSEVILGALQAQLELIAAVIPASAGGDVQSVLERAVSEHGAFTAIYEIDHSGAVLRAAVNIALGAGRRQELIGSDLSRDPIFRRVKERQEAIWSDKYLSPVSSALAIAVGVAAGNGIIIGEMSLDYILKTLRTASGRRNLMVWVVDRHGEILADSEDPTRVGVVNLGSEPLLRQAGAEAVSSGRMRFEGRDFEAAIARSDLLNWYVVTRTPGGLANPRVASTLELAITALAGSMLVGLLLAPLWAIGMARPISAITERTRRVADGQPAGSWPRGRTIELNELSADLERMAGILQERQQELEARVQQRTEQLHAANAELSTTLEHLQLTQNELVRSEKLAALGALVAGIAHELNTPLGNGVMAVSTLRNALAAFRQEGVQGLKRSSLDRLLEAMDTGTDIASRNLIRAAELVTSFKQVAADQTSSQRREFALDEVCKEIIVTLQPLLKRNGVAVSVDVPLGLPVD
jgi:signal transduction histidine kinase